MNSMGAVDAGTRASVGRMYSPPAILRCIAALLLLFAGAGAALAQPVCPVTLVQGNGQELIPGVASAPLVFRQTANFASPPIGNLEFFLAINGDATFASGGQTRLIMVPWTLVAGSTYQAEVTNVTITSGQVGGPILVAVQSMICAPLAPPLEFTAFGGGNDPPEIVAVEGDGAVIQPGQTVDLVAELDFPYPVSARAPKGGFGVDFTIVAGDGSFLPNGTSSVSVPIDFATDRARATLRAGSNEGTIVVEAGDAGLEPARFTIIVQRQQTVTLISGDGQSGRPGTLSRPLVAEVRDANGLPVSGATVTWGIAFGVGPTLTDETTVTGPDGRTSNTVVFGANAVDSVVVATLPGGETVRFRVSSALAGLDLVSGDNQSGAAGSDADAPIVFTATDTSGNPATGQRVDFSVVSGSATLLNASDVVSASGTASVRFRYGAAPGTVRIQGSFLGGQFLATATATAFGATGVVTSGNNQSAAPGTRLPQPLVVQLNQPPQGAKGLGGVSITWTVTAGGGRVENASTLTDANGRASNQFTLGPGTGTNSVRADIPGGASVAFTATAAQVVPGNATFEIASGNNQSLASGAPSAPLVVRLRTATGAPVPGATIAWRLSPAANGSVAPATSVTNAQGEASTVATLGLPGNASVFATVQDGTNLPALTFALNGGVANIGGLSRTETAVASAIDAACPALVRAASGGSLSAGQQDLLSRCSELVGNANGSPADVARALNQMLNDEAAAQDDAAFNTVGAQSSNLAARIAALRSGSAGINLGGLTLAGAGGALPLSFLPSTLVAGEDAGGSEVGADFSRWGFFASGTIGQGDRDTEAGTPGYEFDTYGLTAGVDYRWSDRFVVGAAFGYSNNDTDVDLDQGRLETKGYSGSLYATWYQGDAWYADGVLTYGSNSYELSRRIRYQIRGSGGAIQTVDQTASASPDGDQLQFALSAGRDFNRGAWSFGPYGRVTMTQVDFDAYVERMANPSAPGGGLAMAVAARELKSLEGVLGGKVSYTMSTSWGVLLPHLQVEYLHEFEDSADDIVARFANDPTGTAILVPQATIDTGYFNLGLGLSGVFANGRSAFLYYERRAGQSGYSQDSLALGVRIEF